MQADLSFGEYLRRLRRDKRMPLQDVARNAGLSSTHLSRLENDNGLPTTDTVVKIHNVLGGDLSVMLELARCLPDEILDRYIRRADDEAPAPKRSALGQADDPIFAEAFVADMAPAMRQSLARYFGLSDRDAEGLMMAMRRLAKMDPVEREQVIGVLKLATRGLTHDGGLAGAASLGALGNWSRAPRGTGGEVHAVLLPDSAADAEERLPRVDR